MNLDTRTEIRLSRRDKAQLERLAKSAGMTVSQYLRWTIRSAKDELKEVHSGKTSSLVAS